MLVDLLISERVQISFLLPDRSNITDQIIVKELRVKILPSVEEIEEYEIKTIIVSDNLLRMEWDKEKVKTSNKEIEIVSSELNLIKSQIIKLDKQKEISKENLEICLKFRDLVYKEKSKDK